MLPVVADEGIKTKICNSKPYLNCIGASSNKCLSAYKQSDEICMKKYSIDDAIESEKEREYAKKYATCVNAEYIKYLSITNEKYEVCAAHLEPILDEHHKSMLKQHRLNQEIMRKLEEAQYN